MDKHKLVHQLNVPYRDLRILDPMVGTNPSAHHNLQNFGQLRVFVSSGSSPQSPIANEATGRKPDSNFTWQLQLHGV